MRLEARLGTDSIVVSVMKAGGYDSANDVRKAVTGSRYMKALSARESDVFAFRYPLSADKCVEMREAWGNTLKVHRALSDWYRGAASQRAIQVAKATQTDAKLVRVAALYPELNTWLKGDQRVTAAWCADLYRGGGLLADEVGTGKTAGVVAGLVEANVNGPTLIVCPKISVKAVWGKELARHCPDVPVYLARGKRQFRERAIAEFKADPRHFKVLVIVAEMLRIKAVRDKGRVEEHLGYEYPELFDVAWQAVVVDESQKLLGSLDVVRGNLAGEGVKALRYAPDRIKLAVSATPFGKGGTVDALFGTLYWLWPDEFSSRWAWLRKYFEVTEDKVFIKGGGGATKTVNRIGPVQDEERLWRELGPRVLRRTMEEVSPAHRGLKHFYEVLCEMEAPQLGQYKSFSQDAELAVDGGIVSAVGTLDFMTRCRQFANGALRMEGGRVVYTGYSAKIEKLIAHLEQMDPTRKLVVASQYNEFLDAVERRLDKEGVQYYRLDGKTTERQREHIMNEFQSEGGHRIFLLNGQAGGVSITLDAADEMHCLDEMYPPEANTQLYGRIFRRGRVHQVFFYLYRSMGTIDERIGVNVGFGAEQQARLLDGRRGKAYVRELAQYKEDK
jgi:SNF2 family DNA or RNA helicase